MEVTAYEDSMEALDLFYFEEAKSDDEDCYFDWWVSVDCL